MSKRGVRKAGTLGLVLALVTTGCGSDGGGEGPGDEDGGAIRRDAGDAVADAGLDGGGAVDPDGGLPDGGAPDGGPPDGGPPDGGLMTCALAGSDFATSVGKAAIFFRFDGSGAWAAADTRGGLATTSITGSYTQSGADFTIVDGLFDGSCPATDVGRYTLAFTADCEAVTFAASDEPCESRELGLDGATLTRLP